MIPKIVPEFCNVVSRQLDGNTKGGFDDFFVFTSRVVALLAVGAGGEVGADELSGAGWVGGFLAIRLLAFVTASILPENVPTRY
jgi:hypothetical protein